MFRTRLRTGLLPTLSVGLAVACGGTTPPAAPAPALKSCPALPLTLAVAASAHSNALAASDGRPVQLRIYQLRSDVRLRAASFEDVWQNEAKTLEGEIVTSEQHTVFPGSRQTISVAPKPDANYLGLVALFREPQGKDWLLTYEIAPPNPQPPCPAKAEAIRIWLDRMQIQDGAGRAPEAEEGVDGQPPTAESKGG
jgi:type VI secretion system protein VasD